MVNAVFRKMVDWEPLNVVVLLRYWIRSSGRLPILPGLQYTRWVDGRPPGEKYRWHRKAVAIFRMAVPGITLGFQILNGHL